LCPEPVWTLKRNDKTLTSAGIRTLDRRPLSQVNTMTPSSRFPPKDPYFGVAAGHVWSYDPESYAGGSVFYW
jgi:hypothetical protein